MASAAKNALNSPPEETVIRPYKRESSNTRGVNCEVC